MLAGQPGYCAGIDCTFFEYDALLFKKQWHKGGGEDFSLLSHGILPAGIRRYIVFA